MKTYRFGEPKTFVDDIADEDLYPKKNILKNASKNNQFDLKSVFLGIFLGVAISYLFKEE